MEKDTDSIITFSCTSTDFLPLYYIDIYCETFTILGDLFPLYKNGTISVIHVLQVNKTWKPYNYSSLMFHLEGRTEQEALCKLYCIKLYYWLEKCIRVHGENSPVV